ncbi:hypothetical protein [Propionivibrio sp.]|uniref:hypothetical protein n=1 Tax=Propionivibrio sp. TaxID=2212460 RepID=UPI003BF125EE
MKRMTLQDVRDKMFSAAPFHPYADFDDSMDSIRIHFRDCSSKEVRISPHFTVLYDNNPNKGQQPIVGMSIKGFHEFGIPLFGVCLVSDILDSIVGKLPDEEASEIKRKGFANPSYLGEMQVEIPSFADC